MGMIIKRIDLGGVNCYLGCQEGQFVLFDTGGYMLLDKSFDNRRALLEKALAENGCDRSNLKLLVLTHGDIDHVANAANLKKQYGLQIAMHKGDLKLVQNPKIEDLMTSLHFRSFIYKVAMGLLKNKIQLVMKKTQEAFESFTPDIYLDEGDSLASYGFDAQIISLPGHTEGSIGILTDSHELIVGDLFQNNKKLQTAMNAADYIKLDESVERVKALQVEMLYMGHGTPCKYHM